MMTHGSVLSMPSMLPFHAVLLSARVAAVVLLCVVCQIARVPAPRPTARRPARLQRPKQSAPLRSARLRLAVQRPTAIGLLYALSANKADSLRAPNGATPRGCGATRNMSRWQIVRHDLRSTVANCATQRAPCNVPHAMHSVHRDSNRSSDRRLCRLGLNRGGLQRKQLREAMRTTAVFTHSAVPFGAASSPT